MMKKIGSLQPILNTQNIQRPHHTYECSLFFKTTDDAEGFFNGQFLILIFYTMDNYTW